MPDVHKGAALSETAKALRGHVAFTGGAAPTVDLEYYVYDADEDDFLLLGSDAGIAAGDVFSFNPGGLRAFIRVSAVANNPTEIRLRVAPLM
jgi:hypothetical protein